MISGRALAAAAAALCTACLCPPKNEDWLAIGFRTPEQAFRTFQTAVRADAPELEYRCFSSEFVQRNRLSKLAWREARDVLREKEPLLRVGIAKAEPLEPARVRGKRATILASAFGKRVAIDLVREDFGEIWSADEPVFDSTIDFAAATGTQTTADGNVLFFGRLPVPPDNGDPLTEIRVGREWKIDGLTEAPEEEPAKG